MKKKLLSSILIICITIMSCASCSNPEHFNQLAMERDSKADEVIASLELKKGDSVADIGAGGGFFTIKLARSVGSDGIVYAVDISKESLDFIRNYSQKEKVTNIQYVLATVTDSKLPERTMDLIFLRNTYHDMDDRVTYFSQLKKVLKSNGRIAIIDYTPDGILTKLHGHYIDPALILKEMQNAGYSIIKTYNFLTTQSFMIFSARQ